VFCVLLLRIPQSPRWLSAQGQRVSGGARLSWAAHRRPIFLAVALALFNQLSGINAILYYLGDIFSAAGFSSMSADLQSVAIGLTNLVATVLGMSIIDRVGRKTLLLIGSAGTALALGGVAAVMISGREPGLLLWLLIGFIAFFALSQGAVIWVYMSEIFPTPVRARGQSVGSATHWVMNALISAVFPVVAARSQGTPFIFFAAMMLLQLFVVARLFPETKAVTLEQMEDVVASRAVRIDSGGAQGEQGVQGRSSSAQI
jgi:hypothetical protein